MTMMMMMSSVYRTIIVLFIYFLFLWNCLPGFLFLFQIYFYLFHSDDCLIRMIRIQWGFQLLINFHKYKTIERYRSMDGSMDALKKIVVWVFIWREQSYSRKWLLVWERVINQKQFCFTIGWSDQKLSCKVVKILF